MKPLEYIPKAILNGILLTAPVWDFVDPLVKLLATLAGILLTIVLIRKAIHDTEFTKEQKRKLKLENDMKDQELWRTLEARKNGTR